MEYQNRKYPRLKEYDYSLPGYYYVTIHKEHSAPLLSVIEAGSIHQRAAVNPTQTGSIAIQQLLLLEKRYGYVRIDKYVIMPTHIHMILRLTDGSLPRLALTDIIGAYKSLVTREVNGVQKTPGRRLFQRSFYETVIRSEASYQSCWKYIDENPDKWDSDPDGEWDARAVDQNKAKKR